VKKSQSSALLAEVARLFSAGGHKKKYLVGISGGRDSMALLSALRDLGLRNLAICHLDHSLRGRESRADARFVARAATALGLGLESARARTSDYASKAAKSVELAARDLRYAFFEQCAARQKCSRLILAHHADDQIETCLHHFLRGSGAAGLAGMRPVSRRGKLEVIRPLLGVTRDEINTYIAENRIAFREDATNTDTTHTRNRIRHSVIPAIREAYGNTFHNAILRASEILRMEDDWIEAHVPEVSRELACADLRAMAPAILHRTVLRWLRQNHVPEPGLLETRRVLSLLDVERGPAKVSLPGNFHARRREGLIFLGSETS